MKLADGLCPSPVGPAIGRDGRPIDPGNQPDGAQFLSVAVKKGATLAAQYPPLGTGISGRSARSRPHVSTPKVWP